MKSGVIILSILAAGLLAFFVKTSDCSGKESPYFHGSYSLVLSYSDSRSASCYEHFQTVGFSKREQAAPSKSNFKILFRMIFVQHLLGATIHAKNNFYYSHPLENTSRDKELSKLRRRNI